MLKGILALDMGGTNVKGGLFGLDAMPLRPTEQVPMDSFGEREAVLETLGGFVRRLTQDASIEAISVSTPGPFRYRDGMSDMTKKYPAIRGVDLRKEIRARGNLPEDVTVEFLSDANSYLLGERFFGAGRGIDQLAAITLGTGLGYSVMEDGAVLVNENGRPFDLLCFTPYEGGLLENLTSGTGVAAEYKKRTGKTATAKEMAQSGDPEAIACFCKMADVLSLALKPRMAEHHTKRLIVGGQMAYSLAIFQASMQKNLPDVEVVAAEHIPDAALYGAAAHALKLEKPWKQVPGRP